MKKIKLFIGLSLIVSFSYSQTDSKEEVFSKHEISVFAENFLVKNQIYYGAYGPYYQNYEVDYSQIGIGYRFHFKKSAIRSRVSFGSSNRTQDNGVSNKYTYSSLFSDVALGYELHLNKGKSQLFYGADLNFSFSHNKGETNYSDRDLQYDNKSLTTGFGISPLIGIKYHFTPTISASTEVRVNVNYFKTENTNSSNQDPEENKTSEKGVNSKIGPKGFLSLNFHF